MTVVTVPPPRVQYGINERQRDLANRFEDHCPKIIEGDINFNEGRLVFAAGNGKQLSLPDNAKMILELCDGKHSIRQIATLMLSKGHTLSFKLLMETLKSLQKKKMLEEQHLWPELADNNIQKSHIPLWRRSILRISLARSSNSPRPASGLFALITALIIASAAYRLALLLPWHVPADFIRPDGSYLTGILFLIATLSVFRVGKGLCQGLMIRSMTGRTPRMDLELQPLGFAIETNAHEVWEGTPIQHLAFALSSSLTPLAMAAVLYLGLDHNHWERDAGLVAFLWTFFELSPFRGSDFTWFFSRRAHGAHSDHLGPFLRKKSLFALFKKSDDVEGEKTLLAFASLSILWVFGLLYFCLSILNAAFAHLFADLNLDIWGTVSQLQSTSSHAAVTISTGDSIAAGLLLITMLLLMVSWVQQAAKIFFSNALDPLQGALKSFARDMGSNEQRADDSTAAVIAQFPIFNQLPKASLDVIVAQATFKTFKNGTRILIQGEEGEEAYVMVRGNASIEKQESSGLLKQLAQIGPGAVFGEMGLIEKTLRTADVRALCDCQAMLLTPELLELLKQHAGEEQTVLDRIFISQHMASSDLFKKLPPEVIHIFANKGVVEHLDPGQVIIQQDEIGTDFYLLLRGKVDIEKNARSIRSIEQGGFFGEIALLADTPRTATVKTLEATSILKIDAASFWDVLTNNINMATLIENVAETRLEEVQHG